MTKSVPQALADLGQLYEERNKLYGSNYRFFGHVLSGMFPKGITLKTPEQFNRFALFLNVVHKCTRYARAMPDKGHQDSCDDICVYTAMLNECDGEPKTSEILRGWQCPICSKLVHPNQNHSCK